MREIKCRGLNVKGLWEYGYVVREQFRGYDETLYPECNNGEFLTYEKVDGDVLGADSAIISYGYKIYRDGQQSSVWVRRDTIGQHTTHKDKNGEEIYEGDIIRGLHDFGPGGFSERIRTIEWKGDGYMMNYWKDFEVIGNIYEDPELAGTNVSS